MYVLRPGRVSGWLNLDDMLRSQHEAEIAKKRARRELHEQEGIPLDDARPWHERAGDVLPELNIAIDGEANIEAAAQALLKLELIISPVQADDLSPYVSDPEAASLELQIRSLSKEEHDDRMSAIRTAAAKGEGLSEELLELVIEYVGAAVAGVRGLEDEEGPFYLPLAGAGPLGGADIDALRSTKRLLPIFYVARDFQSLTGAEKKAFGRRAQMDSSTSETAPAAHCISDAIGAVTGAPSSLTSPAPSARQTPALDGTSSRTPGSTTSSSSSQAPPAASSGSPA